MDNCRILYFRGRILEATDGAASADLVKAAKAASSRYPALMYEIWREGRKAAVVLPCREHDGTHRPPRMTDLGRTANARSHLEAARRQAGIAEPSLSGLLRPRIGGQSGKKDRSGQW